LLIITYPASVWHPRWGDFVGILPKSLASANSPCSVVWHCLHYPRFSLLSRTPTCDGWTDGQTHIQWQQVPC